MRVLLASRNTHKVRELEALLGSWPGVSFLTLCELCQLSPVIEDGLTFRDNAVKKALGYARQSGIITIADDSGLCVDALHGAPGVHSARFAGSSQDEQANCTKLLEALRDVRSSERTARFECWIALAAPDKVIAVVSGSVEGVITDRRRGKNGFGYDPLFLYPQLNKTFAEIPSEVKDKISHRARALCELKDVLGSYLESYKKSLDN